jgi:hypothetical protein
MRGMPVRGRKRRIVGASVGALVVSAMLLAGFAQAADAHTRNGHKHHHKPAAMKCEWVRNTKVSAQKHHAHRRHHPHRGHARRAHRRGHWVCTPVTTAPKSTTTTTTSANKPATPTTKASTTTVAPTTTTTVAPTTTTTTTEPPEPETTTTTTVEPFCLGRWVNGVCIYDF